ncbi:hypothetical protein LWP59_17855 [Amycolatopsis acidiphila]|uniref:Uncharacterized protein n=1 Tax=Amycolatopsis acidiphila TaxID=715473 RepID=A0A558ANV3_9PSEU|nr:hypothetical protein [Amycolatopsis acidiphila]TVT25928.1 hypothetical protein FNH06_00370 [Amycolatopsis acidiphila]UIJ63367.1 hypothetical protein LWP59_17855 [Amycolatopsis acidiphila]
MEIGGGIGPLADALDGIDDAVVVGVGGVETALVGDTDVVGTALVVEVRGAGTDAGVRRPASCRGSISWTIAGALGPDEPRTVSAVDRPSTRSPKVITAIASANATTAVIATRRQFGGAARSLSWVRRRACSYSAAPAVLRPLTKAAPATVPATPRDEAATAAETAARALAATSMTLSRERRAVDGSATRGRILATPSRCGPAGAGAAGSRRLLSSR